MRTQTQGVTFIEVVIVIALMAITARSALLFSFDSYRGSSFRSARDGLLTALLHVRSESMNDMCSGSDCTESRAHGVKIEEGRYVLFEGSSFLVRDESADEYIQMSTSVAREGFSEIVFATSSSRVNEVSVVTLSDSAGHHSTITVGTEGQISWTQ